MAAHRRNLQSLGMDAKLTNGTRGVIVAIQAAAAEFVSKSKLYYLGYFDPTNAIIFKKTKSKLQ